jgi:uncharacterized protein YndB with AHSA1/START domain
MDVQTQTAGPRELILTRTLNAPREIVFAAWTDPHQLARWWGPQGFDNPVCEADPRPGGAINIHMRGPDGTVYPMGGHFEEVTPPSRLVFIALAFPQADGSWLLENRNTVTFERRGEATEMRLHVEVLKALPGSEMALAGMEQGWGQTLDRLEALAAEDRSSREIVLSRTFDAPRELVWEVWTQPPHAEKWWGPNGFTTTTLEHEFRVGGTWRHTMHGPDGRDYPSRKMYYEIEPPARLVYSHGWDDDALPPLFLATISFNDLGGKTEVQMRSTFSTAAERERVVNEFGAIEGGKQTLAKLGDYLATITNQGNNNER